MNYKKMHVTITNLVDTKSLNINIFKLISRVDQGWTTGIEIFFDTPATQKYIPQPHSLLLYTSPPPGTPRGS